MDDDNQILVPPSFMAVYTDARGRLTDKADAVRTRYELCEDLAGHLVEHALCTAESGVSMPEATWIVTRLAELLVWQCPLLQAPPPTPVDDAPPGLPSR